MDKTLGQIAFENDDDWAGEPETWDDLVPSQKAHYEKIAAAVAQEAVRRFAAAECRKMLESLPWTPLSRCCMARLDVAQTAESVSKYYVCSKCGNAADPLNSEEIAGRILDSPLAPAP
jgi:hypothetical protein